MSERRIWLEYAPWKYDGRGGYEWTATKGDINPDDNIEYVRADMAEQREAELVEALRIAWRDSDIRCAVSGGRVEAVLAKYSGEESNDD